MFKIGDYAINDNYGVVIHITNETHKQIINAQEGYRKATESEIKKYYHKEEFEVTFPNGYSVNLFEQEGRITLGLVNQNGYFVSDTKLTETNLKTLKEIIISSSI
ncbi:hypothetical protein WMZ97_16470 [Lentibacillus sp. N15]|uniref:hypothetical protein n=1 Tax=Lentibacillus songyuanensis TaxID=3136161 RepID=UPI0031BBA32A